MGGCGNSLLHANFSLDSDGEFLALVNPAGTIVDSVTFTKQVPDISRGRKPDGSDTWVYFAEPTPEKTNNSTGITCLTQAPDVVFSIPIGILSIESECITLIIFADSDNPLYH